MSNRQLILNNVVIESRVSDNFVNLTKLCQAGGKEIGKWYRLDESKELIKVLEDTLKREQEIQNNPVKESSHIWLDSNSKEIQNNSMSKDVKINVIDIVKNGPMHGRGSWGHIDLAICVAQWISAMFNIQVSRWVREILITGSTTIDSNKTDKELNDLMEQLQIKDNELTESKNEIKRLEDEKMRMHELSKNKISFHKHENETDNIYLGSGLSDHQGFIEKIGTSIDVKRRTKELASSSSPESAYVMRESWSTFTGLGQPTERVIHALLEPLHLKARQAVSKNCISYNWDYYWRGGSHC